MKEGMKNLSEEERICLKRLKESNVQRSSWKGIDFLKSIPSKINNPQTILQQGNRQSFKRCLLLTSKLLDSVVHPIWNPYAKYINKYTEKSCSGYSIFLSQNAKHFKENITNFPLLTISRGLLPSTDKLTISNYEDIYLISWSPKVISSLHDNDLVRLVVISDDTNLVYSFMDIDTKRKDTEMLVEIASEDTCKNLHFYLFFQRDDEYSEAEYCCSVKQ